MPVFLKPLEERRLKVSFNNVRVVRELIFAEPIADHGNIFRVMKETTSTPVILPNVLMSGLYRKIDLLHIMDKIKARVFVASTASSSMVHCSRGRERERVCHNVSWVSTNQHREKMLLDVCNTGGAYIRLERDQQPMVV